MQTQLLPILAPRAGLNLSLPGDLISDVEMSGGQNVYIEEGKIKKRPGYDTLGNNLPLAGPVIGLQEYKLFGGTSFLMAVTTKLCYYLEDPTTTPYWETAMSNEVEDDCETTWTDPGANVTVADDTGDKKVGSTSQKITLAAGFTTGLATYRDQSLGDKSAYSFVRLWIKSDIATAAGDIQFLIDDTGGCGSPKETLDVPALVAATWTLVFLEASDPASNMDSIESLGINIATDNGAQVINIDDIRFVKSFDSNVAYDVDNDDTMSAVSALDEDDTDLWWLMSNTVDTAWKLDGTPATNSLGALGGSPPVCTRLLEFKNYMLLLDITTGGNRYPQRVQWSDTGDLDNWSTSGNYGSQDLTGEDWLMGAVRFKGDYIAILKKNSVWLGYATGDSAIFQFDQRVAGIGAYAANSIKVIDDVVIFLGADDVYAFDGIDSISIAEKIRNVLKEMSNPKQVGKSIAEKITDRKEWWLITPSSSATYPDTTWCFNYQFKAWTKHILGHLMSSVGTFQKQTSVTIGDLVGTIGEQNWRIGERSNLEATPTLIFGDVDGNVYEYNPQVYNDNGLTIDGWFSTKDFNPTGLAQRWRMLRIDAYFIGDGMDVEYSEDKGISWTRIASFAANNNLETPQMCYLKEDMLMCRLRFRNAEASETFEFSRANVYWQAGGVRL